MQYIKTFSCDIFQIPWEKNYMRETQKVSWWYNVLNPYPRSNPTRIGPRPRRLAQSPPPIPIGFALSSEPQLPISKNSRYNTSLNWKQHLPSWSGLSWVVGVDTIHPSHPLCQKARKADVPGGREGSNSPSFASTVRFCQILPTKSKNSKSLLELFAMNTNWSRHSNVLSPTVLLRRF